LKIATSINTARFLQLQNKHLPNFGANAALEFPRELSLFPSKAYFKKLPSDKVRAYNNAFGMQVPIFPALEENFTT
jgi:hypothetical protein